MLHIGHWSVGYDLAGSEIHSLPRSSHVKNTNKVKWWVHIWIIYTWLWFEGIHTDKCPPSLRTSVMVVTGREVIKVHSSTVSLGGTISQHDAKTLVHQKHPPNSSKGGKNRDFLFISQILTTAFFYQSISLEILKQEWNKPGFWLLRSLYSEFHKLDNGPKSPSRKQKDKQDATCC